MKFRPQDGVWQPALRIQQGLVLREDGVDLLVVQAVHGPYDPAVFYGKKDLPLREVNILPNFFEFMFNYVHNSKSKI